MPGAVRVAGHDGSIMFRFIFTTLNFICFTIIIFTGCISFWGFTDYDHSPLAIQTLNLFNQKRQPQKTAFDWDGDWIFRRKRLELIDQGLRETKPDIFVVQEGMEKIGNSIESDREILLAGVLTGYEWQQINVQEYEDTGEREFLAVAVDLPVRLISDKKNSNKQIWKTEYHSSLMAITLRFDGMFVPLFNYHKHDGSSIDSKEISELQQHITAYLRTNRLCLKRVILTGSFPVDSNSTHWQAFLNNLQLKDSSNGFCEDSKACETATPTNGIYKAIHGDFNAMRVDRIIVHQQAEVNESKRNFDNYINVAEYGRLFHLKELWPTERFGWFANALLPRCGEGEGL